MPPTMENGQRFLFVMADGKSKTNAPCRVFVNVRYVIKAGSESEVLILLLLCAFDAVLF